MKIMFLIVALLSFNAFAVNVCDFDETPNFHAALKAQGIKTTKVSKNHKRFTFSEKKMIHLTVTGQNYLKGASLEEALEIFGDFNDGKPGPNAGQIKYWDIEGKTIVLVHYWPGENEYGAFYQVKRDGSFRLLARVEDSWINCNK